VNHYYTKSEEDYRAKMGVPSALDAVGIKYPSRRMERLEEHLAENNEVEDMSAVRYFESLRNA
jgi:hypothetical protein